MPSEWLAPPPSFWEEQLRQISEFWDEHPIAPPQRCDYLVEQCELAIAAGDRDRLEILLSLARWDGVNPLAVEALNRLLLLRGHTKHQEIVRDLQSAADPSSVPFLRRAIDEGFDSMVDYNGSGPGPVAKWFSHAFANIGTREAIEALRHYQRSHPEPEVRDEMTYRLRKLYRGSYL